MFVGAAQGISKTMSMEMGRIIVGAFLAIGAWQGYATTQTFPYIVTYDFVGVWILCGLFLYLRFCGQFLEIYSVASEGILGFGNWPFNNVLI
jgi:hypothetical protein